MSQNFELLSQLEAELNFGRSIPRVVPDTTKAIAYPQPVAVADELANLAQTVFLSRNGSAPHDVVICGVDEKSASSEICLALGRTLARCSGRPVCLVDANIRSPRLLQLLNQERRPTAVSISARERVQQVEKDLWLTSVEMMESTSGDSLAAPDQLKKLLDELRESYAFILIDAPAVNSRSDAAVLGQIANGTLLVIEANTTRKAAALKAKNAMEALNVRLLGCVLNNRTFPIPEKLYGKL